MVLQKPLLISAAAGDLIDKILKFNEAVVRCSLEEPMDIIGCLDKKAKEIAPTYAAMREFGVGEFDVGLEDILVDGIVIDEEKAKSTPCKCIKYDGKDLCWSPGVIGLLRQDQIAKYCVAGKIYENKPKLIKHLNEFKKIAEETKGLPLMERIAMMRALLSKQGATVGAGAEDDEELEPPAVYPEFKKIEPGNIELDETLPFEEEEGKARKLARRL